MRTRISSIMVTSWTPKVCKIMAFKAVILGLGLLFTYFWGLGSGLVNE